MTKHHKLRDGSTTAARAERLTWVVHASASCSFRRRPTNRLTKKVARKASAQSSTTQLSWGRSWMTGARRVAACAGALAAAVASPTACSSASTAGTRTTHSNAMASMLAVQRREARMGDGKLVGEAAMVAAVCPDRRSRLSSLLQTR